jgi:hypothetical protein
MNPLIFIYPHDDIFQDVKQETSYLAERMSDSEGNSLFESLVFDEEYLPLFRRLFFDARSCVTSALSTYMRDIPASGDYDEAQDFTDDRNYELILLMPEDFNFHLAGAMDAQIRQFLVAYIMYRWLETKLSEHAPVYLERADRVISDIKCMADSKIHPIRRWHGYW